MVRGGLPVLVTKVEDNNVYYGVICRNVYLVKSKNGHSEVPSKDFDPKDTVFDLHTH